MGKTPDYQKRAVANYLSKRKRLNLTLTFEQEEDIRSNAAAVGESMNTYILKNIYSTRHITSDILYNSDIVQDTPAAPVPSADHQEQPQTQRDLSDLPQPPDSIPKDNRTALVMWLCSHGWSNSEIMEYFDDGTISADTVAQLSQVPWDILNDSATLQQPPQLPEPPEDIATAEDTAALSQWLHDHGYTARQIRQYLKDNRL